MKPMLCKPEIYDNLPSYQSEWVAEEKFDGVRSFIKNGELHNRRGDVITHKFPEIDLSNIPKDIVLDGELMCDEFELIAGRVHTKDKLKIRILSKTTPATFMAFDIPSVSGDYDTRRAELEKFEGKYSWLKIAKQHTDIMALWERVKDDKGEGIVIKYRRSGYAEGKRSPDWLKIKMWLECIATFTSYKIHPRGVRLETDTGRSVNVNGAQAVGVKKLIDDNGSVECEVQYLPQQNSDAWRFPSFKRVVGDGI